MWAGLVRCRFGPELPINWARTSLASNTVLCRLLKRGRLLIGAASARVNVLAAMSATALSLLLLAAASLFLIEEADAFVVYFPKYRPASERGFSLGQDGVPK